MKFSHLMATLAIAGLPTLGLAQSMNHQGAPDMMGTAHTDTPATTAFREVNARMHATMNVPYTNNVDVDFVRSMIPHHQGAIDMAKIALQHTSEPEMRKLAEDIIRAQETEIAQMRVFLKRKGAE